MVVEGNSTGSAFSSPRLVGLFGNYMELTLYLVICLIICELGLLLIDIAVIKYLAIEKARAFRVRIISLYDCWFLLKYCSFFISCFSFLVHDKNLFLMSTGFFFFGPWSLAIIRTMQFSQALVFWTAVNSFSPIEGLKFLLLFLFLCLVLFNLNIVMPLIVVGEVNDKVCDLKMVAEGK